MLVSEYLGEIYPPYRWCERLDVIEQAQQRFGLKPALPDFYNILLERPRHVRLSPTYHNPISYLIDVSFVPLLTGSRRLWITVCGCIPASECW